MKIKVSIFIQLKNLIFFCFLIMEKSISKIYQSRPKQSLKFIHEHKDEENNQYNETNKTNKNREYDNTLIERDIKDPSPTINASFRVIGKKNKNIDLSDNDLIHEYDSPYNRKFYKSEYDKNETNNEFKSISSDWEEDNFSNW